MNQNQRQNVQSHEAVSTKRVAQRRLRILAVASCAVITMGLAAGCGDDDDDDTSPEEAFCAAGDSLSSNISGLADVDVISEGTDALNEQFSAIESDLDALQSNAGEVAADEIEALDAAVDELGAGLEALGEDVSVEGATDVAASLGNVVTAAQAVFERLQTTC